MAKQLHMVVDLQFGSTGKGALAGLLGEHLRPDTAITAWGPNAGHTYVDRRGEKFVHTMLANSMVCGSVKRQLIGPGSVVNMEALVAECERAAHHLKGKEIVIHPAAPVLSGRHAENERKLAKIGSTMKGTAAAAIEKIWRDAEASPLARHLPADALKSYTTRLNGIGMGLIINEYDYDRMLDFSACTIIEGAQGFSLGIHTHFWPYTTSRDISPAQILADCRIPLQMADGRLKVWGTARTFPIRVANRFAEDGRMVGTSGPVYGDQRELDWRTDLGREPELTTVTKLPRRIFSFSEEQMTEAARICGPSVIALTFCDYLETMPRPGDRIGGELMTMISRIRASAPAPVRILTFGPSVLDSVIVDDDGAVSLVDDKSIEELI